MLFSIFGNFFPIYFGALSLYFLKKDFTLSELLHPLSYAIYGATFTVSSAFLWYKSQTTKSYLGFIFILVLFAAITVFFIISNTIEIQNKETFSKLSLYLFIFTVLKYLFHEFMSSYYQVNSSYTDNREKDYEDLRNEISQKG